MRILHTIDSGGLYGAEVMLLALVEEQLKSGLKPVIASIGEKGIEPKALEVAARQRGFPVEVFRMHPGPNIAGAAEILRFAWRQRFDILHSHGYKTNILFGFLPRRVRKLPMVSTLHGYTSTNGFSRMRVYEWLDAICLKSIDQVILVNRGMLRHPKISRIRGVHFCIVDNGIPIAEPAPEKSDAVTGDPLDPAGEAIVKFCQDGFTIGSIGRLSKEKGFEVLIDALLIVVKRGIDARLVIIGDGSLGDNLQGLAAERGLEDRVLMPGYRRAAYRYLPLFDVFAIPSYTEGLPVTLLEALRAKLPVVATAVGGIPEVLEFGKAGCLVEPGNPGELAAGIARLHDEPDYSLFLADRAYKRFRAGYSSFKMAQEYHKIYRRHV